MVNDMKIMTKLTLKELLQDRKTFILCFISVLLSCILLFTVGLAFSTVRQNQINSIIDDFGDFHAIIKHGKVSEKNNLENNKIKKYYYIYQIEDNLYGISDNFDMKIEGSMPTNNTEVLIDSMYADSLKLKIGSNLNLNDKDYKVVGIYQKSFLNFTLDNIILTKDTENDNYAMFFIYLNSYNDMNLDLDLLVSKFEIASLHKNEALINYLDKSDDSPENQVYMLLTMFICLILAFIIFFIIYNAFSISVNEKKKKYATYKSVGATPKQILYAVFLESLIVLIIAIPLGFLLSLGFVSLILFIINNLLEGIISNVFTLEIYPLFIFISLIFILLSTLFATFSVARIASKINIIDEVKQTKKFRYRKSNKLIKKLLGIECLISANNVTRDRAKYRITTISVVIGIILFLVATTLLSILLYDVDKNKYDEFIRVNFRTSDLKNNTKEEIIDSIKNLDSVSDIVYYTDSIYKFETKNNFNNIISNYLIYFYVDEDNYNKIINHYKNDNILVNTLFHGQSVFDDEVITLDLIDYETEEIKESLILNTINDISFLTTEYSDIFKSFSMPTIIGKYDENIDNTINIYIRTNDYLKLDQEITPIIESDSIYYTNTYVINHNSIVLINCVKLVIYLALGFITFITIVSIIGTISASLNLRRKEFAILKSIGLSNKQFNKMIFYESLMLSLKSLLFGILLFILIASIFIKITMINNDTFENLLKIPLNIYLLPLLICIVGVIVIVYLSFLIATHKIKKDNIADVIKIY